MASKPIETQAPQFLDDEAPEFGRPDGAIAEEAAQQAALQTQTQSDIIRQLGHTLFAKFTENERKRQFIEERWLQDLRQFHGRYDPNVEADLREAESCQLFLNITKPKTYAFSARVMDMVLPTDDNNWGIEPRPVPEIAGLGSGAPGQPAQASDIQGANADTQNVPGGAPGPDQLSPAPADQMAGGIVQQGATPPQGAQAPQPPGAAQGSPPPAGPVMGPSGEMMPAPPMTTPQNNVVMKDDIIQGVQEEAKSRCDAMEEELEDQLDDAQYNNVQREAIEQMAKLGTGIIMGPVIVDEWRVTWVPTPNPKTGKSDYVRTLKPNTDKRPGVQWVDCWNFYPDMSAAKPDEWGFAYVQYLVNSATFRKMAKRFNFDPEAVSQSIDKAPFNIRSLSWLNQLRELSETNNVVDTRHRILRYYGEITRDDLMAGGKDPEQLGYSEHDTIYGTVWLCEEIVLKVDINPLDSGEMPFSIAYCDKDESSPFGRGIPRIMRGEQDSINGTWRMIHDNAGLSVSPQTVIKSGQITPADGDYHLKPRKLWYAGDDVQNIQNVFAQFSIDSHQAELANILQMAIKFSDDVTMLPLLMQGDGRTMSQMPGVSLSLLWNASTVVLRRAVKFYDDYVTVPMLGRFYEWNMQFNDREDIKGDFAVTAKGSSTLMDKEQQAKALDTAMQLAMQPTWQPYTDMEKLYKEALKAKRIPDIILPQEKIDTNLAQQAKLAEMQAQSGQKPAAPPDPYAQQKMDLAARELDIREAEIQSNERIAAAELSTKEGISLAQAQAAIAGHKIVSDTKVQIANAEQATKMKLTSGL